MFSYCFKPVVAIIFDIAAAVNLQILQLVFRLPRELMRTNNNTGL